jgi:CDGSH-type Zn-finger protein/ferredoxin
VPKPLPTKQRSRISPLRNGPYLVAVDDLTNSKGERLEAWHGVALCRCGASAKKPFCDGSHIRIGFSSERRADHARDEVVDYRGVEIIVHFNRLQCAASERCTNQLPQVFREGDNPWVQPNAADREHIIEVIRRCPSGALRYTLDGQTGPLHENSPSIRVAHNGPYEVQGLDLDTETWCEGASRERFMLCRCGASKNKPFCDGTHRDVNFQDDRN